MRRGFDLPTPGGRLTACRVEGTAGCVACGALHVPAARLRVENDGSAAVRMDWCGGCLAAALAIRLAALHERETGEPVVLPNDDGPAVAGPS